MTDSKWIAERDAVPPALRENAARRAEAQAEVASAREELQALLVRGQNVALDVAAMSRDAGISRETAHRLLRDAGSVSMRRRLERA